MFCIFSMKIDYEEEEYGKINKDYIFFNQEWFYTLNNDVDRAYEKFHAIQTWFDMVLLKA